MKPAGWLLLYPRWPSHSVSRARCGLVLASTRIAGEQPATSARPPLRTSSSAPSTSTFMKDTRGWPASCQTLSRVTEGTRITTPVARPAQTSAVDVNAESLASLSSVSPSDWLAAASQTRTFRTVFRARFSRSRLALAERGSKAATAPELPTADNVGVRFAGGAAFEERVVARLEVLRFGAAGVDQEPFGRPAQDVLGEQTRVEVGLDRRDSRPAQALAARGDSCVDRHDTAVASLSFSDW